MSASWTVSKTRNKQIRVRQTLNLEDGELHMPEQSFDALKHIPNDSSADQSNLSNYAFSQMTSKSDFGKPSSKNSEPDFLDFSINDPTTSRNDIEAPATKPTLSASEIWNQAGSDTGAKSVEQQADNFMSSADADHDGQLNKEELTKALLDLDLDKDGSLSADELGKLLNGKTNDCLPEETPSSESCSPAENCPHESGADEPAASHEEAASHEGGHESGGEAHESHKSPLQQLMQQMDANGDGKLSFDELFQFLDVNHDGKVSLEELQQFLQTLNDAQRQEEEEKRQGTGEEAPTESGGGSGTEGSTEGGSDTEESSTSESDTESSTAHGSNTDGSARGSTEDGSNTEGRSITPGETLPRSNTESGTEGQENSNERTADGEGAKQIHLFPANRAEWQTIIDNSPQGSMIVTPSGKDVNWNNDKPFDSIDPDLKQSITDATSAGLNPMGYVGTRSGTRPLPEVFRQIDSWFKHTDVKGIYLGASGNSDGSRQTANQLAYSQAISDYVKSYGGKTVFDRT
jgi:Ca2+-binding EF-hand superfamily protein